MGYRRSLSLVVAFFGLFVFNPKLGAHSYGGDFPANATFSTLIKTPYNIQGFTSGLDGEFYAVGRNTPPGVSCPVWRIDPDNPTLVVVGYVPAPSATASCITIGTAFNEDGDLFVADTVVGKIYVLTPNESAPPLATEFGSTANGVANIAFDRDGNLWATDGPSNQGRLWKIPPSGGPAVVQFRVPPTRNGLGVGREVSRFPLGNTLGMGVAAGLAFNEDGDLFIADVSRGAIWKVEFNRDGSLRSKVGCDSTYAAGTLCLENVFAQHPIISGAGGIALDRQGNIWVAVLDRNAIGFVSSDGAVSEVSRSPASPTTGLRNEGPFEFPAIPVLEGRLLCVSNLDSNIQDNSPNTAGEIVGDGSQAAAARGKIVCMDQDAFSPGLSLPIGEDRGHHGRPWYWPRRH